MKISSILIAFALLAGCHTPKATPKHAGQEVIIKASHRHSKYCGHYEADGRWYYMPYHRHGLSCGHKLVEAVWTLKRK